MLNALSDLISRIIKAIADWIDRCLPVYQPAAWNDGDGIQLHNNCYNYGCDIQTNTFAQPGRAHGITLVWPADMNCAAVTAGAIADKLVQVNCDDGCGCSECRHQVALVIAPNWTTIGTARTAMANGPISPVRPRQAISTTMATLLQTPGRPLVARTPFSADVFA